MANEPIVNLARSLLTNEGEASLATLDASGAPFASLVTFATDARHTPLLLISNLARHTQNLSRDPRASLLVSDRTNDDTQARSRATFIGKLTPLTDPEKIAAAKSHFLARHPSASTYAAFPDFRYFALSVDKVHMVQGFGRILEFDGTELA